MGAMAGVVSLAVADDPRVAMPEKALFSVAEAAAILGISVPTVYRWIEAGVLIPHLTIKPYRLRRASLVRLLSQ